MIKLLKKVREWHFFLNVPVAIFIVGAGLAIQTQPHGVQSGYVLLLLLFVSVMTNQSKKFPSIFSRQKRNQLKLSIKNTYLLIGVLKEELGFNACFTKLLPFTMSCSYVVFIYVNGLA